LLFRKGGVMKPQMNWTTFRKAAIVAVFAGFSLVAAAKTGDSEQISIYMHLARTHATQAAHNLALLQTYSMAGIPWQVHFNRLQQVQDNVNAIVKDYNRLNALRDSATPEQVEALNSIQPMLQDLQAQVKETLRYLDYHSNAVNMPPFTERVHVQYASVNQIFNALCNCARKNNVLVASAKDKTAASDCSGKTSATMP
jgi:hypothetical protein